MSAPDSASLQWRYCTAHRAAPSPARSPAVSVGTQQEGSKDQFMSWSELARAVDRYPHLACAEKRVRSLNDDNLP